MKFLKVWFMLCFGVFISSIPVFAAESQFAYNYTTDLLPKGQKEIEQWFTWRHAKDQGKFDVWEGRTAFEYGVTDNFQAAFYLNYLKNKSYHNGIDGTTAPAENFAERQPGPDDKFNEQKFKSVSLEGIYRLLSPYKDPIGLALYFEPSVGQGIVELEGKIILQKNFFEDRLVIAGNITIDGELRHLPGDPDADVDTRDFEKHWDRESDANITMGVSYRFMPNWSAGFEFLNEREFSALTLRTANRTNNAYYIGPTLHYGAKDFFVTATFLNQLPWAHDYTGDDPSVIVGGRNYADDFERYRLRVKTGFYF